MNDKEERKQKRDNWKLNLPMMSNTEIKKIVNTLKKNFIVFEWGSGGSTIYFSKYVKKYISIEHDINWFRIVRNKFPRVHTNPHELYYVTSDMHINTDMSNRGDGEEKYHTYLNFIDTLPYKRYDVIIVDGRARFLSCLKSIDYMDENSLLLIHDYNDDSEFTEYPNIRKYFDIIEIVEDLCILKLKNKVK